MFDQDMWGRNRLHWEALGDDLNAVKYLVSKGMSMNVRDNDGFTPLHLAISANNERVVAFLCNAGASIKWEYIQAAEQKNNRLMCRFLKSAYDKQAPVLRMPIPRRVVFIPGLFETPLLGPAVEAERLIPTRNSMN